MTNITKNYFKVLKNLLFWLLRERQRLIYEPLEILTGMATILLYSIHLTLIWYSVSGNFTILWGISGGQNRRTFDLKKLKISIYAL